VAAAKEIGKRVAERAKAKGINQVVSIVAAISTMARESAGRCGPRSGSGVLMQPSAYSAASPQTGAGWRPAANWQSARIGAVENRRIAQRIKDLAVAQE